MLLVRYAAALPKEKDSAKFASAALLPAALETAQ